MDALSPIRGFVLPCLLTTIGRPPSGSRWMHEVKHDGYRIIARKEDSVVRLWTRRGNDVTDRFARIAEGIEWLSAKSATVDGEAVVRRPNGHSDFYALKGSRAAEAVLYVFDLLELDGQDLRAMPIEARRAKLALICAGPVIFSETIDAPGPVVFEHACRLGLEGIVSKVRGSAYTSGRCPEWVKTLNPDYVRRSG